MGVSADVLFDATPLGGRVLVVAAPELDVPGPAPTVDPADAPLAVGEPVVAPAVFAPVTGAVAAPEDGLAPPDEAVHVPAPSVVLNGTALSGNLQSFGVSWNNQQFNQGSPKPDGTSPANTTPVTGVYNAATGAFTLQWSSQVVGGPFNGFSAFWNLTGTFTPSGSSPGGTGPAGSIPASGGTAGGSAAGAGVTRTSGGGITTSSGASPRSTTTTTTPTGQHQKAGRLRDYLTARTGSTTRPGWGTPVWLIVLLAALVALGGAGVVGSELARRKQGETP